MPFWPPGGASPGAELRPLPPPPPKQLEVLHVQHAPQALNDIASRLAIVLPDGTPLGSRRPAVAETVVLLPGGPATAAPAHEMWSQGAPEQNVAAASARDIRSPAAPEQSVESSGMIVGPARDLDFPMQLAAPAGPGGNLLSLSQRLGMLLGPSVDTLPPSRRAARQSRQAGAGALLRRAQAQVLGQVNALTDAVLQHVLADTAVVLDQLPTLRGHEPESDSPQPVTRPPVDAESERNEQLRRTARDAEGDLLHLEESLRWRYASLSSAATGSLPRPGPKEVCPGAFWPSCEGQPPRGRVAAEPSDASRLRPAALPLERVREIERYRTQFVHHYCAAREAGIDRGSPSDPASTATWVIWPYLADLITASALEGVIEEVHVAMEQHVEELISKEIGQSS